MSDISKRDLQLLEKMFDYEVARALRHGDLPFQTRSKIIERLEAEGLVERASVTLGGRLPVTVHGWELTHAGRFLYCATCTEEPKTTPERSGAK